MLTTLYLMSKFFFFLVFLLAAKVYGQFAPAAGQSGTTAIHKDSAAIVNWASSVYDFQRGWEDVASPVAYASFGDSTAALYAAEGNSTDVVSLGDGGVITLAFEYPIENGVGPDFAVFENSFSDDYLEFAHVEVSSDGISFIRFPSTCLIENNVQTGPFGYSNPEAVHNLAGKYQQGYGTPFDLEDIADSSNINLDSVLYVRLIDVVGSIDPVYGSHDHLGNLINDPYPTAFESGGFDLDGVGVIHENNVFASQDNQQQEWIQLYPNPARDVITIRGEVQRLVIYNMSGKLMFENQDVVNCEVDLITFESGVYSVLADGNYYRFVKL